MNGISKVALLPFVALFAGGCATPRAMTDLDAAKASLSSEQSRGAEQATSALADGYERACGEGDSRGCREAIAFYWHGVQVEYTDPIVGTSFGSAHHGAEQTKAAALFERLLELEWQKASHENTIGGYRRVVDEFPGTRVAREGDAKLDVMLPAAAEAEVARTRDPSPFLELADKRTSARSRLVPLVQKQGLSARSIVYLQRVQRLFVDEGPAGQALASQALVAEEEQAWKDLAARGSTKLIDYQGHQTSFPRGAHHREARAKEMELAYGQALAAAGPTALDGYASRYPDAPNNADAQAEAGRRRQASRDAKDDEAWIGTDRDSCRKSREAEACTSVDSYLQVFPTGRHVNEAKAMLDQRRAAGAAAAAGAKAFCQRANGGLKSFGSFEKFCKAGGEGDYVTCVARSRGCL